MPSFLSLPIPFHSGCFRGLAHLNDEIVLWILALPAQSIGTALAQTGKAHFHRPQINSVVIWIRSCFKLRFVARDAVVFRHLEIWRPSPSVQVVFSDLYLDGGLVRTTFTAIYEAAFQAIEPPFAPNPSSNRTLASGALLHGSNPFHRFEPLPSCQFFAVRLLGRSCWVLRCCANQFTVGGGFHCHWQQKIFFFSFQEVRLTDHRHSPPMPGF